MAGGGIVQAGERSSSLGLLLEKLVQALQAAGAVASGALFSGERRRGAPDLLQGVGGTFEGGEAFSGGVGGTRLGGRGRADEARPLGESTYDDEERGGGYEEKGVEVAREMGTTSRLEQRQQ